MGSVLMKKVIHVVGARPNFMKIAPLMKAVERCGRLQQLLVNTGQHYDENMAGGFFTELGMPRPHRDLGVGSGSHASQTARVMIGFEEVCLEERPDLVVVVGDVNSTMAAAIVAAKLVIPVAHVEAGLRSFDPTMPEEVNRVVADRLSQLLFTPSADADENLRREGVAADRIHLVGNIMIDTLFAHLPLAKLARVREQIPVEERKYAVVTLHRPSNVDDVETLTDILGVITEIARDVPVVFPVHPRTRSRLSETGADRVKGLILTQPLGYIDFLSLTAHARIVLTDSGGLQEETTALGVPCLTLRKNTERPITITHGTNRLVGIEPQAILAGYREAMTMPAPNGRPPLWDGHTAERIADVMQRFLLH
jgi:UDP-N-acetylglucosamine 2-epimerase (non-hydrolysing)